MHTTSCNYFQENFKETRKLRISQTIWIKFQKTSAQDLWSFTQRRNELQFYIVPQCSLIPVASILSPLMMQESEGSVKAGMPKINFPQPWNSRPPFVGIKYNSSSALFPFKMGGNGETGQGNIIIQNLSAKKIHCTLNFHENSCSPQLILDWIWICNWMKFIQNFFLPFMEFKFGWECVCVFVSAAPVV